MKEQIETLISQHIRPALNDHGGDISVIKVEDGNVYVTLSGGCQGCAGARMTLKNGVERFLKEAIPEIKEVIDLTDHSSQG